MGRGEHMPEATTCPGSQPCHPPGQPGGLLLFPQLPRGRLPYPSTAQGCCPHQLVQVRKLLPAPKGDRAERTSPGPSWQSVAKGKRMLFWDVTSGDSPWWVLRVYFSGCLIRTEELIPYSPQQPEAEGCTCNSENILTTYKDLYFHGSSSWQYKCN